MKWKDLCHPSSDGHEVGEGGPLPPFMYLFLIYFNIIKLITDIG